MTMLPVPEIDTSAVQTFVTQATEMLASAEDFRITSPDEHEAAGALLRRIRKEKNETESHRRSLTKPIDEFKTEILDQFRPVTRMLNDAEEALKKAMLLFQREEERIRLEEEAKQREQARKERERLEKRAKKAEEKAQPERAAALQEQASEVATPRVQPRVTRAAGTSVRKVWRAEVTNFEELVKAVAKGKAPITLLQPDMKVLNKQAKSLKRGFDYPGVIATCEDSMGVSASD